MQSHVRPLKLEWNQDLIRKYDIAGPRYTSYPTAPQFQTSFSQNDWLAAVARSNLANPPLSLYFHIPFCATVCYYCGCNKIITADTKRAANYLTVLKREIELQATHVTPNRQVHQLHFGGGTPTYLNDQQLTELMQHIRQHFHLLEDGQGEYSIEIHPQTVTPERLNLLRKLGFNRLSIGVQDFDPAVQQAVNRFNSENEVAKLLFHSRALGYSSVSLDLIYGLPKQTESSFAKTLDKVIQMRPDRISLFNYAHMPHLFKVQKQINAKDLPEPQTKLQMLHNSINQLVDAGYSYIGMDHFALASDELAKAQQNNQLHRNFQGYTTGKDCDLLGFGVSAINSLADTYAQNYKDIEQYTQAIENNKLPITKGYQLSTDDKIRRHVINELACHFHVHIPEIEAKWGINFKEYFADELQALKPMIKDNLVKLDPYNIYVHSTGKLLVRCICMVFDRYLQTQQHVQQTPRYSRII